MVQQVNSPEPMTDPFQKAQDNLKSNKDATPRLSAINKKYAGIAVAAALLGGTAFTATRFVDNKPVATPVDPGADPGTTSTQPVAQGETHPVSGGTITPNEHVAIAHTVQDNMTFEQAYAAARQEVGQEGMFSWHGHTYNTFSQAEWNALSLPDRQTFLSNVGFKPTPPATPAPVTPEQRVIIQHEHTVHIHQEKEETPQPVEPVYVETSVNGMPAIGIDDDGDGMADVLVVMTDENTLLAFLDGEGDNGIETIARLDPITYEVIETAPIDTPFEISMDDLESPSQTDSPSEVDSDTLNSTTEDELDEDLEKDTDGLGSTDTDEDDDGYHNNLDVTDMA